MKKPHKPSPTKVERMKAQAAPPRSSSEAVAQTKEPPRSMSKELFAAKPTPVPPTMSDQRRAAAASMERTFEEVEGRGELMNVGTPAPRGTYQPPPQGAAHKTLNDRAREAKGLGQPSPPVRPMSMDELARQHARSISTDLHATDESGSKMPTLADRVRTEGVKAQLKK